MIWSWQDQIKLLTMPKNVNETIGENFFAKKKSIRRLLKIPVFSYERNHTSKSVISSHDKTLR